MITIAIIDDDIPIGDMLAEILTQEGYAVLVEEPMIFGAITILTICMIIYLWYQR